MTKRCRGNTKLLAAVAILTAIAAREAAAGGRQGFVGGGTLGLGRYAYSDGGDDWGSTGAENSISVIGHAGIRVNAGVGVVVDLWGHNAFGDEGMLALGCLALQAWPTERLWLRGGFGVGALTRCDGCGRYTGWGGLVAAGHELARHGSMAVDVNARIGFGSTGEYTATALAIGVGLTWD